MGISEIGVFTGGFTFTNGYLRKSDAGTVAVDAPDGMAEWIRSNGWKPDLLLLTHWHFDHVIDAARLQREHGCRICAWGPSTAETRLERHLREWAGLVVEVEDYPVHEILAGRDRLAVPGGEFRLAHVPGHSPDSVVFIDDQERLAFTGDTLMEGGIGRSDFPDGDGERLLQGIRDHLLTLPERYRLLPGHGKCTTVAREAQTNPFLA